MHFLVHESDPQQDDVSGGGGAIYMGDWATRVCVGARGAPISMGTSAFPRSPRTSDAIACR